MNTKMIISAMREAGFNVRSYSGRGMYGDSCVAVSCDENNISDVVLDIVSESMDLLDWYNPESDPDSIRDSIDELISSLKGAKMDSMGLGYVVYWPNMAWPNEVEDED